MEKISECEEKVLMALYEIGEPSNMAEILERVGQKYKKDWKPQTMSTFLSRLTKKGYLHMQKEGRTAVYTPTVSMEDYQKKRLEEFREDVFLGDAEQIKKYLA